jgi:hypothetical protein
MTSLERRIDQIFSSGEDINGRFATVIDELVDSEAYLQLRVVLNKLLGDTVPQQVTWLYDSSY